VTINGETGFLLPPQSVVPLADSLTQLALDADLRRQLGRQGRDRFTEQFRHENMTRELRDLYQKLLA
jgi:glycosyltransferase involved in cell wall biosynthesis